jgi:hypothetical protein
MKKYSNTNKLNKRITEEIGFEYKEQILETQKS